VSAENRVSRVGEDTYDSVDGKIRFGLVGGQWHRFDLSYSPTSPIDGPGNGFGSLDEVVRVATGQSAVIV
jgi:hypothetical protein